MQKDPLAVDAPLVPSVGSMLIPHQRLEHKVAARLKATSDTGCQVALNDTRREWYALGDSASLYRVDLIHSTPDIFQRRPQIEQS